MAFCDWDHNGKSDAADHYIGYQIYKSSQKSGGASGGGPHSEGPGCGTYILAIGLIFIVMLVGGELLAWIALLGFLVYEVMK